MTELAHEMRSQPHDPHEKLVLKYITERIQQLMKAEKVAEDWFPLVLKFVKEVVGAVCPSVRARNDHMDINQYLDVITVQ